MSSEIHAEMPEPANGSVLYWPPTYESGTYIGGVVAVRDDTAGREISGTDANRWLPYEMPADEPLTWADLWAWGHQYGAPVDEARVIPAAPTGPTPTEMVPARRGDLYAYMHACGHVEWLTGPPEGGGCDACESGSEDPADWSALYSPRFTDASDRDEPTVRRAVLPAVPAAPTDAQVEAAARAMHFPNLWKALTDDARDVLRRSASAALTAAAEVRAGVAR